MRPSILILATALLPWSHPAAADTASDISALEQTWGQAFLKGDRGFLERLLTPEFKLMRAEGNKTLFTPRAQWLASFDRYIFHEFVVRTVDVVEAGDTAVATVTGRWKVGMQGRAGTRDETFILSDTFVKRAGAWKVLYRRSTPSPNPS